MKKIFTAILLSLIAPIAFGVTKPPARVIPVPPTIAPIAVDPLGISPAIPQIYKDGLLRVQVANPTPVERAAFSLYEAALQVAEALVQTSGCNTPIWVALDTFTDSTGAGDMFFNGRQLFVTRIANDTFRGDKYRVTGVDAQVMGVPIKAVVGNYSFNLRGTIMEGDWIANVSNPTAPTVPDVFTGKVIKDFFLYNMDVNGVPRDVVLDWGLQVIDKKGFPASKYWQRSRTIREDGVEGETIFQKTRIAGGPVCSITIATHGNNNPDYFYQQGYLTIKPVSTAVPVRALLQ
jgi:hypothetical protein